VNAEEQAAVVGYAPDEILTSEPTRSAKLKWVVVVSDSIPPGQAVNAAVCVAAVVGASVPGLLGPAALDGEGDVHLGLPWAGCSILAAPPERLVAIRAAATAAEDVLVADMPTLAQSTRIYDEYLKQMAATGADDLAYYVVSLIGPRNKVDKIVRKLPLLP
jgi:Protein of unknown function (DUF2000)